MHILQRSALALSIGKPSHFHAHLSIGNNNKPPHFESLQETLHAVGNRFLDSYVLSESSLFICPTKIIIKTCGTTQLLKSIHPLLNQALNLGLSISFCKFTRGNFIFPKSQPFPHTSFKEEVIYLENCLPDDLYYRKASVDLSRSMINHNILEDLYTIEICMTELDRITGIKNINPNALICNFGFDPCGYSMNEIDGCCLLQSLKRTQMIRRGFVFLFLIFCL
ncbi:hypothetical protein UlMin_000242 [Ulmus minor]